MIKAFESKLMKKIRKSFYFVDKDIDGKKRIFFENSGGSYRLKKAVEIKSYYEAIPDCPERIHKRALDLIEAQKKAEEDILKVIFNAKDGVLDCALTASQLNFKLAETLAENIKGTNIVTTCLEHPSSFDASKYCAEKYGKELRVAKANPKTGAVDVDEIVKLIDKDTCYLSVMYASNISGAVMDIENIVKKAREVKSDLFIICDAVQHVMHGVVDLQKTPVDAILFAPYKFFCTRGSGYAYISDRMSKLKHHKLLGKAENVWELGSPTPSNFASVTAVVDYVCSLGKTELNSENRRDLFVQGMTMIRNHETALYNRLLNGSEKQKGLLNIKGVKVLFNEGGLENKDLILGVAFENKDYAQVVLEYAKRNITVYERVSSSLYSSRMLKALEVDGCIRISPLHCNNFDDVDEFLKQTEEIAKSN